MKKIFLSLCLLVAVVSALAIPAKPGLWSYITLADGTEVRVQRVGDEHGHWLRAEDGRCFVMEGDSYVLVDAETVQAKRQSRMEVKSAKRRAIYSSTSDGLGKKGTMSMGAVPSIGEYTIPVVMVQFSDLKFKSSTTVAKMKRYYNEEGYSDDGCIGSVRDYFKAQSGGQFIPTFDVVGIVTLDKSYKDYGENDRDGNDKGLDNLPGHVISAAISQLGADFSKYVVPAGDSNHTTGVPLLAMLYAGKGEATEEETTSNSYFLWPCEWDDVEDPVGYGTYNGVHFNSFFVGNELNTGGSSLMGMSVFCHEFGHALGLPDFYCTDYSYSYDDAFGLWSIMDSGAYVDSNCRRPMGYTAYEKSYMGWLEMPEIGTAETVTLQSPLGAAVHSAYIVRNSSTETFIFENRQPGTWYPADFGSGVLVSRIAYSYNQWNNNTLNNTKAKKRACVLTADGEKLYYSASSSNLYGYTKTSIASLKTLNGSSKNIGITNITKNNDKTITLTLSGEITPDPPTPTPGPDGALFFETFSGCKGLGGNDGSWSGSIANAAFNPDNDGWSTDKAYGANQCAKFGNSNTAGSAVTPEFTINGTATLTFLAGAWNGTKDGTSMTVSVDGNGSVTPSEFTMTRGAFNSYTATVKGTGVISLIFEADRGRFFLDEVKVIDPKLVGIKDVTGKPALQRFFTLDGRFAGTDFNALPRGLYIVNGKKILK